MILTEKDKKYLRRAISAGVEDEKDYLYADERLKFWIQLSKKLDLGYDFINELNDKK